MLSVLSVLGVEKRIGEVPGVESVTVNFAAKNATVRYDETRLDIADIKSDVRQIGYGLDEPAAASASAAHEGHKAPGGLPATPVPAGSKASPPSPHAAGADPQGKTAPGVASSIPPISPPEAGAAPPASPAPAGDGPPDQVAPDKK